MTTSCNHPVRPACVPVQHPLNLSRAGAKQPVLLFGGTGTSPCDVIALENILDTMQLNYATISSSQLNDLNQARLNGYRLLIVPGGSFIDMSKSLTPAATADVQNAVHHGLNYLGICAGGFLAGKSDYYNGFNLTSGVTFNFFAAAKKNIRKTAVPVSFAGGTTQDHYWEDGPEFTGWGTVIGKYPDNTPAIVEGACGSGWVILTGIHAEAPDNWRQGITFNTTTAADNAYAATLIRAALNKTVLPHF